jgi:hypothetical protein
VLDRDRATEHRVMREQDLTHGTAPDRTNDLVSADLAREAGGVTDHRRERGF